MTCITLCASIKPLVRLQLLHQPVVPIQCRHRRNSGVTAAASAECNSQIDSPTTQLSSTQPLAALSIELRGARRYGGGGATHDYSILSNE